MTRYIIYPKIKKRKNGFWAVYIISLMYGTMHVNERKSLITAFMVMIKSVPNVLRQLRIAKIIEAR